jgi:hypothetical protein
MKLAEQEKDNYTFFKLIWHNEDVYLTYVSNDKSKIGIKLEQTKDETMLNSAKHFSDTLDDVLEMVPGMQKFESVLASIPDALSKIYELKTKEGYKLKNPEMFNRAYDLILNKTP